MQNVALFVVVFAVSWLVAAFTDLRPGDTSRGFVGWRQVDPETSEAHLSPGAATVYRIVGDRIVSNANGVIGESVGCTIFDVENWNCPFDDGSGGEAMQEGQYVFWPTDRIVGVSQFQWHLLQCQSGIRSNALDAIYLCGFGPFYN